MGAGASMEEDYTHSHPPERTRPHGNIVRRPAGRRHVTEDVTEVLSHSQLYPSRTRKAKAALLGRKTAVTINVDSRGFNPSHVHICEGQSIFFQWNGADDEVFSITQTIHTGDRYEAVVGGYNSGPVARAGTFTQQFNIRGEYHFVSAGMSSVPLRLLVSPRKPVVVGVTEEGFSPPLVRIDQGTTLRWAWRDLDKGHSVREVEYCSATKRMVRSNDGKDRALTKTGNFVADFQDVGLYYFQTEGRQDGETHMCMVHVRERQREYSVRISDAAFEPPLVEIEEGDRVWLHWDEDKCERLHCPYEINAPALYRKNDGGYKPKENGFHWREPTKSGLMAHDFFEAGVYYYVDHDFESTTPHIGTIVVKPKQKEHFVSFTKDRLSDDISYLSSGDRLWWYWPVTDSDGHLSVDAIDKSVSPVAVDREMEDDPEGTELQLSRTTQELKYSAGLETAQLGGVGVYHYNVARPGNRNHTFSVVSKGGSKNHGIEVTDGSFEPKVLTVYTGDRVWWSWTGRQRHNILQVSHQGNEIAGGFCSGAPIAGPSAYMCEFRSPGVHYCLSEALKDTFCAVIVKTRPTVHEVRCTTYDIIPDPQVIRVNDVVAWIFSRRSDYELHQVSRVEQVEEAHDHSHSMTYPRVVLSRMFTERDVYHFTGKTFEGLMENHPEYTLTDTVSSVIVDETRDHAVIHVDSGGFHPDEVHINKGMTVLWTWKSVPDEAHNIINQTKDAGEHESFDFGPPARNQSYLYTFDEVGTIRVGSEGAPGLTGAIHVHERETDATKPEIVSEMLGGKVPKNHIVTLSTKTSGAKIYFTIDGSSPDLFLLDSPLAQDPKMRGINGVPQLYDPNQGVELRELGWAFVRGVAVKDGLLKSEWLTSSRYLVLEDLDLPKFAPVPVVCAAPGDADTTLITWEYHRNDPRYRLVASMVDVLGVNFGRDTDSTMRFEAMVETERGEVAGVQHSWKAHQDTQRAVRGLIPGKTYMIYVVSDYSVSSGDSSEEKSKSNVVRYTVPYPDASATKLRVTNVDIHQVTLRWDTPTLAEGVTITGFQLLVEGKPYGGTLKKSVRETVVDNIHVGHTVRLAVATLTSPESVKRLESNEIRVTCPQRPPSPWLQQRTQQGTAIATWEKPDGADELPQGEGIVFYRVYVGQKCEGEVSATLEDGQTGYQLYISNLEEDNSYPVTVRAYAGQPKFPPGADHVYCICEGDPSNVVYPEPDTGPVSPILRLVCMDVRGIDIAWEMPAQFGKVTVTGFQLVRDGKYYGSIIPPDVHSLRISDVRPGDTLDLQLLALVDRPVRGKHANVDIFSYELGTREVLLDGKYYACEPSPQLLMTIQGLVEAPVKVRADRVTGGTALVVWDTVAHPRKYFILAENYQVTWWPQDEPNSEVNSAQTKEDHLEITGLRMNTAYNVVVEARRLEKYTDAKNEDDAYQFTFFVTNKSDPATFRTSSPPLSPHSPAITATTCDGMLVSWEPPREIRAHVIGIRVDAMALKADTTKRHTCVDALATASSAILYNLSEKAEYRVTVTVVTEEYFEQLPESHEAKARRTLSKDSVPRDDIWLPSVSVVGMTSGTDAPTEVCVKKVTINSVTLTWKPPAVYGSNRLQGTVVRWAEGRYKSTGGRGEGRQNSVTAEHNEVTINNLEPGLLYKFVVEAVVSVKSKLEMDSNVPEIEKQIRKTVYVMSKPVLVQMHAPCEPPVLYITGYSTHSITVSWEKPLLCNIVERDDHGNPTYVKRSLEGYKLLLDDQMYRQLSPVTQTYTINNCTPGKVYKIVLVAVTCSTDIKRQRKKKMKGIQEEGTSSTAKMSTAKMSTASMSSLATNKDLSFAPDDFENDESESKPVEVTLPRMNNGYLSELKASFLPAPSRSSDRAGDIRLDWALQGITEDVREFSAAWKAPDDKTSARENYDADVRTALLPANQNKCVYDVFLEHIFKLDLPAPFAQKIQVVIPGSPDPPEIWKKVIRDHEFVIEWAPPRCYGVAVKGYQLYCNGKKTGEELRENERRATVPCEPNKQYRMNLVALSSDPHYDHSKKSNTVLITTGSVVMDNDMKVKVQKVTGSAINLDWWEYQEPSALMYYLVTWSSETDSTENEMTVPKGQRSCVIDDCTPGVTHYITMYAKNFKDKVIQQAFLEVRVSAPSGPPTLRIRSVTMSGITISWQRPAGVSMATLRGYRVYVNGGVEAFVGSDQQDFTFTHGKWHNKYKFQVQAMGEVDDLNGPLSNSETATWPGLDPPVLRWAPASKPNVYKVTWEHPDTPDDVKVKEYKLLVIDDVTGRAAQILSPLSADCTDAEIHGLKKGTYLVYLEVQVTCSMDTLRSQALRIEPYMTPGAPQVTVTAVGLEQRRAIEKITCELINKRDSFLNIINRKEGDRESMAMTAGMLRQVDEMLDECLKLLEQYTGSVTALVTWTKEEYHSAIQVSGYNVLVDGKQYGETLHSCFNTLKIKLNLDQLRHTISVVALCEYPVKARVESNLVEVMTEPFRPFCFYSFFVHVKTKKALSYKYALEVERKRLNFPINQGLLRHPIKAPKCTLLDIFDGKYRPLFPEFGKKRPTVILFWSKWCPYSVKTLGWFVRFATQHAAQYEFVAVACEPREITAGIRQDLLNAITQNGWREDNAIRHVVSQCISVKTTVKTQEIEETKTHNCYWHNLDRPFKSMKEVHSEAVTKAAWKKKDKDTKRTLYFEDDDIHTKVSSLTVKSSDITELFGVMGLPTIAVVHPKEFIAWKGRYCAFDYASFEHFGHYVLAQVMETPLPATDPWDPNVDYNLVSAAKRGWISEKQLQLFQQPTRNPLSASLPSVRSVDDRSHVHRSLEEPTSRSLARPKSAKSGKLFYKSKLEGDTISVSVRPVSATLDSPYVQKLVRIEAGKKSKSQRLKKRPSTSKF